MHCFPTQNSHALDHTLDNLPSMSPQMHHQQAPTVWPLQVYAPSPRPYTSLQSTSPKTHSCHTPTISGLIPAMGSFLTRTHQILQTEPAKHPATPDLALWPTSPSFSVLFPRTREPPSQGLCIHCCSTWKAFPLQPHIPTLSHAEPLLKCYPEEGLPWPQWPVTPLHTRT